jgi:hypothetical protein
MLMCHYLIDFIAIKTSWMLSCPFLKERCRRAMHNATFKIVCVLTSLVLQLVE